MLRSLIGSLSLLLLPSCVLSNPSSAEEVYDESLVTEDEYSGLRTIEGPHIQPSYWHGDEYWLKASGRFQAYQESVSLILTVYNLRQPSLRVSAWGIDKEFFSARLSSPTIVLNAFAETWSTTLPLSYLRKHLSDGVNIRFSNERGVETIAILEPFYLEGFLRRYEEFLAAFDER